MKTQTPRTAQKQTQRNEPQNGRAELIQQRAYERYLQRGMKPGFELEDWLAAEQEVASKQGTRQPA